MNQIFGQRFIIFENWGIWVNYCWNYGPSKLLLQFIEYRLDQLNNKHAKIVNSAIQYFEGCSEKKCLLKVWSLLVHLPRIQRFGLMKMHNMYKIWFAYCIFSQFVKNVGLRLNIQYSYRRRTISGNWKPLKNREKYFFISS